MIPGEGKTTEELFTKARSLLGQLEKLTTSRRNRDKACTTLTDFYLLIEAIARRIQEIEFAPPMVTHDEEEDEAPDRASEPLTMADLFETPATEAELSEAERQEVDVRELRLFYFRLFIDYQVKGCKTVDDVLRKLLAFARRFRPESLREFGLSLTDVARRVGKSKANIHAGEKRLVERLLKASGARGFHALGGQKSESHRAKCSAAQRGNTNRRDGEIRKKSA